MSILVNNIYPIKYFLIGHSSTKKILAKFPIILSSKIEFEITRIFKKLSTYIKFRYDEKNKLSAKENNYYYIFLKPDYLFIIYANSKYPEKYIFELIDKIMEENILTIIDKNTEN